MACEREVTISFSVLEDETYLLIFIGTVATTLSCFVLSAMSFLALRFRQM